MWGRALGWHIPSLFVVSRPSSRTLARALGWVSKTAEGAATGGWRGGDRRGVESERGSFWEMLYVPSSERKGIKRWHADVVEGIRYSVGKAAVAATMRPEMGGDGADTV